MRAVPFEWTKGGTTCVWMGLLLNAAPDGSWTVFGLIGKHRMVPLCTWRQQVPGKDINEARQRAQAAAIVQHQLRHQRS